MTERSGAAAESSEEGGVKETIESILVAFILAFIFRAFIVEAFVIPTGSMGPTLMGAHLRLTCPDCGYQFERNFSTGNRGNDTDIPANASFRLGMTVTCPNCGYNIPYSGMQPVYFGDRILVLKYRYLFQNPEPWDVVVFKSPFESSRDPDDPKYTDNYIKRLIAEPGQSVMILDGDVYIGGPDTRPKDFHILRKPRHAQLALWRDVYDNDYLSRGLNRGDEFTPWREPWTVESGTGWHGPLGGGAADRRFRFDNPNGDSTIRFDSTANHPGFDAFTDWLAYDQEETNNYVGDLRLTCVYRRTAGDGPLRLRLTKRQDAFIAEFTPGRVRLDRRTTVSADSTAPGRAVWDRPMEAALPELDDSGRPIEIEFSNVDYRVELRVNGRAVLTTDDSLYSPNVAALYAEAINGGADLRGSDANRPSARITASRQTCSIEHLRLARDVYYQNVGRHLDPDGTTSSEPFFASPANIVHLGPDEYFVLGDNSQVSLDARFWGAPVNLPREGNYHVAPGRVPGRFLLGKAFFVYWPAGYRPPSLSFGIEPDFGDMRFIH